MFVSHITRSVFFVSAALFAFASANAAEFKVDPAHTKIAFSVKHMMISTVHGDFKDFTGTFDFNPEKGTLGKSDFTVKTASVDTDNQKRDDHLRSPDFFDAAKFPTLTITNSKIDKASKDTYKWHGDLTIHGVTKPVTFELEFKGMVTDPYGMKRAGFSASTTIDRKDFGLKWNKAMEAGGVVVGDDVKIDMDVEATEVKAGKK